jgi:hypothetical protein
VTCLVSAIASGAAESDSGSENKTRVTELC